MADREATIAREFKPRSWLQMSAQIAHDIRSFMEQAETAEPLDRQAPQVSAPGISLSTYYPITRNRQTRVWKGLYSAEVYRAGLGWWWPDDWGCWIKPEGGELRFQAPTGEHDLRCFLQLRGASEPTPFSLNVEGPDLSLTGTLGPGEVRWIPIDLPAASRAAPISILISGSKTFDLSDETGGLDTRVISVGVAGFIAYELCDAVGRVGFMEALTFGTLDRLAFNRRDA
ncbi:MAG: hypothetical protein ACYDD1_04105 [Caulobacteraceae bacterium]